MFSRTCSESGIQFSCELMIASRRVGGQVVGESVGK